MTFALYFAGDWIVIVVHLLKQFRIDISLASDDDSHPNILARYHLNDLSYYIVAAVFGSYLIYFTIGGFIHVKNTVHNEGGNVY